MSMTLKDRIPKEFYSLFRTKNMDAYMQIVVALYEENNEVYASLGLTREECQIIIADTISKTGIVWQTDYNEDESDKDSGSMDNHDDYNPDSEIDVIYDQASFAYTLTPSAILGRLINWGWIRSDFDEKLNTYVIAFPQYSQMYAELFKKLLVDDDSRERESILAVYSALFTYFSDPEKNNDILKNALYTSKNLGQLLSNMQDGMRAYFDELSRMKDFIGIQKVLIKEINNSDSRRYAILTTTDSFYRYKEAVKELISKILNQNDDRRAELEGILSQTTPGTFERKRYEYSVEYCDKASELVYKVEHEFDLIERKYNKLIEQKTIFAKRALARIHYILQEGADDEDNIVKLINLIDKSDKTDEILGALRNRMKFTRQFYNVTDDSFPGRREKGRSEFVPFVIDDASAGEDDMADFVPKPLYTKKELQSFRDKNMRDGMFVTDEQTVESIEDLEKLLFLWQEETNERMGEDTVSLDGEITKSDGVSYSRLVIFKHTLLSFLCFSFRVRFGYMENVSPNEAENIRKTIQDLLRQTCILQMKCDPVTLIQRDNPRYQVCLRNREFISDYLAVLDCELVHDQQEHLFRITGDGVMLEKMTLLTARIVIIMKMIYRDKIMGEGLNATTTNLAEIREYGRNTNLITRKLTNQEWSDALLLMKTHQMIELPGAIANLEDNTPIYIYGTVNIFCSAMDINELVRMYSDEVELIKYDNESAATLEAAGLNTEGSSVNHTHEFAKNSEMEELPIESV